MKYAADVEQVIGNVRAEKLARERLSSDSGIPQALGDDDWLRKPDPRRLHPVGDVIRIRCDRDQRRLAERTRRERDRKIRFRNHESTAPWCDYAGDGVRNLVVITSPSDGVDREPGSISDKADNLDNGVK